MRVPLIDLRGQYEGIRSEVDEAIRRVVESQHFVMGPEVEALEAELASYIGVPHAVACASGTDALLLPLMALEPQPGDEVIVPAFTFFATAGAVWNAGFRPVFADVDPRTFNLTAETIAPHVGERTRAVIAVHLYGQMADMEPILALAAGHGFEVIEDAAQAIGAGYCRADGSRVGAGASGRVGTFSFFPTKNLGSFGEGGLMTSSDADLADRLAKLRVHGGRQMYHHEMVGTNSRLHALQAAVLRAKLPKLDAWHAGRRRNAAHYDSLLADVPEVIPPARLPGHDHIYNQYTIRARRRDELRAYLSDRGIGSGIYYPVPLHLQECFSSLETPAGSLPVSETLVGEVLSLPVFPELSEDQVELVATEIQRFYGHA